MAMFGANRQRGQVEFPHAARHLTPPTQTTRSIGDKPTVRTRDRLIRFAGQQGRRPPPIVVGDSFQTPLRYQTPRHAATVANTV